MLPFCSSPVIGGGVGRIERVRGCLLLEQGAAHVRVELLVTAESCPEGAEIDWCVELAYVSLISRPRIAAEVERDGVPREAAVLGITRSIGNES
jgi:hypothetical protein